jgi:hypothetical protein
MLSKLCRKVLLKNRGSSEDLNVDNYVQDFASDRERRLVLAELERCKAEALIQSRRAMIR